MYINMPMLRRSIRRLLAGKNVELRSLASRQTVLGEGTNSSGRPAMFLPGALDKIKALSPWRTWEIEERHVRGLPIEHAPTVAFDVDDVDLAGPFLYKGASKMEVGFGGASVVSASRVEHVVYRSASLVSSAGGSQFFGHLLLDDFPLSMIPSDGETKVAMLRRPYRHEDGYVRALGLKKVDVVERARINRLRIYSDFAQNEFKRSRYRLLRERLRRSYSDSSGATIGAYIKRGKDGEERQLTNEGAVTEFLRARRFEIIDPDVMSAAEIIRCTLDAKIVIGIEGSQLSHAIYTIADNGAFLVLQPPYRFSMAYKEFADCLDLPFGFVVGEGSEAGFSIKLDEVSEMLERLS